MPVMPKNDNEAIDIILQVSFKDSIPYLINYDVVKGLFVDSYYYDVGRIIRKMEGLGLIKNAEDSNGLSYSVKTWVISDNAIEIIKENGTYSNYILTTDLSKKKEDKKIIFDRYIKNGNTIAALLISSLSLILTQCPKDNNKGQTKIEEGMQSIVKELDSLKKVLSQLPLQKVTQSRKDTATNR